MPAGSSPVSGWRAEDDGMTFIDESRLAVLVRHDREEELETQVGSPITPAADLHDFQPDLRTFYADVVAGLSGSVKSLPCKYFYDERGSKLFDEICDLDEYYPTRTELGIMNDWIDEIADLLGRGFRVVEYGSGSSLKTRILLSRASELTSYVPVDISREHLLRSVDSLSRQFPHIPIAPVCADYTSPIRLPDGPRTIVYFPGSTIGNFHPVEAREFLARIAAQCGNGGGLLIGVDLKKDPSVLRDAYNDARGVTAAFNLNLLTRINRELDGDFLPNYFSHDAFYNVFLGRIEMHLTSTVKQTVRVGGEIFTFEEGESIHTECSYKYTVDEFSRLAVDAGFTPVSVWTDVDNYFSVHYLTVSGR